MKDAVELGFMIDDAVDELISELMTDKP